MTSFDGIKQVVLYLFGDKGTRHLYGLCRKTEIGFTLPIFLTEKIVIVTHFVNHLIDNFLRHSDDGLCLTRDGIAQRAAVETSQTCLETNDHMLEKTIHKLAGIGATKMNIHAAMSTLQTCKAKQNRSIAFRNGCIHLVFQRGSHINRSSTACHQHALFLTVEVDELA